MKKLSLATLVASALVTSSANAATYDIINVLNGTQGFGSSIFSEASPTSPQSTDFTLGIKTAEISDVAQPGHVVGTYDDVTGDLNVELHHLEAIFPAYPNGAIVPTHANLTGNMIFDNAGLLDADSTLDLDFIDGASGNLIDGTLGFKSGYVCCGSDFSDPNSFMEQNDGTYWLTLLGANINAANPWDGIYDNTTNLGMNIRLELVNQDQSQLSAVPVPAAVWLFGSGLIGLAGIARRKSA